MKTASCSPEVLLKMTPSWNFFSFFFRRYLQVNVSDLHFFKKQSPRGVLWKRCAQKRHRKTPIKQEPLTQVFSSEFCKIFKNTFSYRTHPVAASVLQHLLILRTFCEDFGLHEIFDGITNKLLKKPSKNKITILCSVSIWIGTRFRLCKIIF